MKKFQHKIYWVFYRKFFNLLISKPKPQLSRPKIHITRFTCNIIIITHGVQLSTRRSVWSPSTSSTVPPNHAKHLTDSLASPSSLYYRCRPALRLVRAFSHIFKSHELFIDPIYPQKLGHIIIGWRIIPDYLFLLLLLLLVSRSHTDN